MELHCNEGREREDELVMCPAAAGRERRCRNPHFKSSRILEGSREGSLEEEGDVVIGMERKVSLLFDDDVILLYIAK